MNDEKTTNKKQVMKMATTIREKDAAIQEKDAEIEELTRNRKYLEWRLGGTTPGNSGHYFGYDACGCCDRYINALEIARATLQSKDAEIQQLMDAIPTREAEFERQKAEIADMKTYIEAIDKRVADLTAEQEQKDDEIARHLETLNEVGNENLALKSEIAALQHRGDGFSNHCGEDET